MNKSIDLRNSHFYCPITEEVMTDPVMDPEGNSYERAAIVAWLRQNSTSPITRSPLRIDQLVPNRCLRKAIEDEIANGTLTSHEQSEGKHDECKGADKKHNAKEEKDECGRWSPIESLDPVRLVLTPGDISANGSPTGRVFANTMVSIIPPDCTRRCPADVVCVVDVSGSMGGMASIPGAVEDSGLSLLDVVKHALKTVISTLQPTDRFALVSYSDVATVVFTLTPLNAPGKSRALALVESLQPEGLTNLWDGLLKGMEILSAAAAENPGKLRNACVLLLTDGVPNVVPPRGHLPMLKRYKDSNGGFYPGIISTFGFGYNLQRCEGGIQVSVCLYVCMYACNPFLPLLTVMVDLYDMLAFCGSRPSDLLKDIAHEGGGMYAFIPDSGFVGTAFVNALANQLVSFGTRAFLTLEFQEGAE